MKSARNMGICGLVAALVVGLVGTRSYGAIVVDFEDLQTRTTYRGESFETGGVVVSIPRSGGRSNTAIMVDNAGEAGGSGNELRVNGLAGFRFPETVIQASFRFSATELRIGVGNQVVLFDLESLDNSMTIDNVHVTVDAPPAPRTEGTISITAIRGGFDAITVGTNRGGRDFMFLDDLQLVVPEPASLLLLSASGLALTGRRAQRINTYQFTHSQPTNYASPPKRQPSPPHTSPLP